ncbi:MAG TPA: hypothetical protein VJN18_30290 [Polyangiaceae bacterium]|nr:hypothetical protein [Polyangiaceae bacterium]
MRVAPRTTVLTLLSLIALSATLVGCPEKAGAPADKTTAEPERVEPDDEAKADDKKKPAAAAPAAPAAADEKKEDAKEEGGW